MNKLVFTISDSRLREIKKKSTEAMILVGFFLCFIPPAIFYQHWYIALPAGMLLVPIWVIIRWKAHQRDLKAALEHSMDIDDKQITFRNRGYTLEIDYQDAKRLDVNLKKNQIDTLLLTIEPDNKVIFRWYENMAQLKQLLSKKVGELNVFEHRWFHKLR